MKASSPTAARSFSTTASQNRWGSRSSRSTVTHATRSASPESSIHERSSTVLPLPAGAETSVTPAGLPAERRSNSPLRATGEDPRPLPDRSARAGGLAATRTSWLAFLAHPVRPILSAPYAALFIPAPSRATPGPFIRFGGCPLILPRVDYRQGLGCPRGGSRVADPGDSVATPHHGGDHSNVALEVQQLRARNSSICSPRHAARMRFSGGGHVGRQSRAAPGTPRYSSTQMSGEARKQDRR